MKFTITKTNPVTMILKKYNFFLLLLILVFTSCMVLRSKPSGAYAYESEDLILRLHLKDSEFHYRLSYDWYRIADFGRYYIKKDTLLLVSESGDNLIIKDETKDTLGDGFFRLSFVPGKVGVIFPFEKEDLIFYYVDYKSFITRQVFPIDSLSSYSLKNLYYTFPLDVKNNGFLTLEYFSRGNRMTIDLSAFKSSKQITISGDAFTHVYANNLTGTLFLIKRNKLIPYPGNDWGGEYDMDDSKYLMLNKVQKIKQLYRL